ncbi:hypothetical protein C8Q74DRAFT_1370732 [Fomes fomentarius]|nr:hypothetical protein C8Q74DRAFT_1370732 [Fomes fomentarius]
MSRASTLVPPVSPPSLSATIDDDATAVQNSPPLTGMPHSAGSELSPNTPFGGYTPPLATSTPRDHAEYRRNSNVDRPRSSSEGSRPCANVTTGSRNTSEHGGSPRPLSSGMGAREYASEKTEHDKDLATLRKIAALKDELTDEKIEHAAEMIALANEKTVLVREFTDKIIALQDDKMDLIQRHNDKYVKLLHENAHLREQLAKYKAVV